ncbi:MAG: hypothetical protein KJP12_07010 [Acidimicrobiia bacterium]|nr:hypothetical protein [Acidimicrobiia bacterium]MBT8214959.1 hypothetical protein [Acidimicrobiia bacterium]NNF69433.1 hypothetical protein [Acidimicrobiia bacterium]NNK92067.1 hypothetical protein [Acidimicrobiia bacterium]
MSTPSAVWARRFVWIVLGAITLVVLVVMSGSIVGLRPQDGFPFFTADLTAPQLFAANTPTGGDMGAHVLLPRLLADSLLPSGRIMGWTNDWYAGFPVLYFYFPLPSLAIVVLDVLLPYGVAFKLVTVAGLLALPAAGYYFTRSMGFSKMVSTLAALTGTGFLFMESFSIFGANIKSTLAGEFAFSWSFALSLVYLGLVVKATREGKRFSMAAAVVLALTALAHVVTTIVVVVVSLPLLVRRNAPRLLVTAWGVGFALSAFWALPLAVRVFGGYTTDMGWQPIERFFGERDAVFASEFVPIMALGAVGLVWSFLRRYDVVSAVWLTLAPVIAFWVIAQVEFTPLYNARLLPYWYYGLFLFAGIGVGLAITELGRWLPARLMTERWVAGLAAFMILAVIVTGIHDLPGWSKWNYEGYEGKEKYPELEALMGAVDELPDGRVMWEANGTMNQYGTPMALMLFPYWTEGSHPSMEGLYFESSLTTPFHFLNASEVSRSPSNPVRGLQYRPMDFDRAVPHLDLFGVDYYVAFTDSARGSADADGLERIVEAAPWTVYQLPETSLVEVATNVPAVYDGEASFKEVALAWYDDVDGLDHWIVEDGPDDWPRFTDLEGPYDLGTSLPGGTVSNVVVEDHKVSFTTDAVGVPHLVKISQFPNWTVSGAEGPFAAAPSLMIVVPTQEDVELVFARTGDEIFGILLTLGALGFAGYLLWRRRTAA